jgi:hypothetical protein
VMLCIKYCGAAFTSRAGISPYVLRWNGWRF